MRYRVYMMANITEMDRIIGYWRTLHFAVLEMYEVADKNPGRMVIVQRNRARSPNRLFVKNGWETERRFMRRTG